MRGSIEEIGRYGVPHPDWTRGLTEADRPTIVFNQGARGRRRLSLPTLIASVTAILVTVGLARSLPGPDWRGLSSRPFSESPRTKVTVSGFMSSQRSGILDYRFVDCTEVPSKQLRRICWKQQEKFSKP